MQFNEQYITKKPPQSIYKLNPDSDRYRICKYCETEFMTSHRSRKYCDNDNHCSNEYHNAQKRYNRDMKKLNEEIEKLHSQLPTNINISFLDKKIKDFNKKKLKAANSEMKMKIEEVLSLLERQKNTLINN